MYRVVFDPFQPKVYESTFALGTTSWKEFHGDIEEELPTEIPDSMGKIAHMTCFVDANHTGVFIT